MTQQQLAWNVGDPLREGLGSSVLICGRLVYICSARRIGRLLILGTGQYLKRAVAGVEMSEMNGKAKS